MTQLTVMMSPGCEFEAVLFSKGVCILGGQPVIDGMPKPESMPGPNGIVVGLEKAPLPKPVGIGFGSMTLRLQS